MSIPQFLIAINGIAQLWAADGQFLGLLSSHQHDPNSISNLHGIYGSPHGLHSIRNLYGIYGGQYGIHSPYNHYCINPPIVFYQGQPALMITRNNYAVNNGLTVIDPDILLNVYATISNSPSIPYSTPMDRLNQSTQDIMAIVYSMFH